jgi:hypothetical protein
MLPVVVWVSQLRQFAGAMRAFLPNRSLVQHSFCKSPVRA